MRLVACTGLQLWKNDPNSVCILMVEAKRFANRWEVELRVKEDKSL